VNAAIAIAEERGRWSAVRLHDVAGRLGVPTSQVLDHFRDLDSAFRARMNQASATSACCSWTLSMLRPADELNASYRGKFRILKGIESDILQDGSLDYPDEVLGSFDFVVASVHSRFRLNAKTQTDRIIRAVSNPFTTILGHLTGRMLLRSQKQHARYVGLMRLNPRRALLTLRNGPGRTSEAVENAAWDEAAP